MVEIFNNLSQLPYTRQNNTLKQGVLTNCEILTINHINDIVSHSFYCLHNTLKKSDSTYP